jgi:small subunit ribosomal protein S4e
MVHEVKLVYQASDQPIGDVIEIYTERQHRIRYPDPAIKVNDTVKIDLSTGKITDFIKFDTGVICMVTGGRNMVSCL